MKAKGSKSKDRGKLKLKGPKKCRRVQKIKEKLNVRSKLRPIRG